MKTRIIMTSLSACIFTLSIIGTHKAWAYDYCSEPSVPGCVSYGFKFTSDTAFKLCKWEMERFVRDSEDYVECLDRVKSSAKSDAEDAQKKYDEAVEAHNDALKKQNEAIETNNKAVEKFNCMAGGSNFCP